MNLKLPTKIDFDRVMKYTGGSGSESEKAAFKRVTKMLFETTVPKGVYRELSPIPKELIVGEDIKKHFSGCEKIVAFAVTLGVEVDKLIKKVALEDVYSQFLIDASASVLVEEVAESFEKELGEEYLKNGEYLTLSYAPGYGDYPLTVLPLYLTALDAFRKIGITPTADNLMLPRKSICAVMGVAHSPTKGFRAGCEHCKMQADCKLRKEGKTCVR